MYEDIINEIRLNLGENDDLNRRYLSGQIEKYKDHPYNKEIIKEISRMMWDCLSEDEKNEWRISLRSPCEDVDVSSVAHKFNVGGHKQAAGLTLKGELEKALKALLYEAKKELK